MDVYLEVVEPAFWNSKIFEIGVTNINFLSIKVIPQNSFYINCNQLGSTAALECMLARYLAKEPYCAQVNQHLTDKVLSKTLHPIGSRPHDFTSDTMLI